MEGIILTIALSCLGDPNWEIRYWAERTCNRSVLMSELKRLASESECPEVRLIAGRIWTELDRIRVLKLYAENPYEYYSRWMYDGNCKYIGDEKFIRDIQESAVRSTAFNRAWNSYSPKYQFMYPAYTATDHYSLKLFRERELRSFWR